MMNNELLDLSILWQTFWITKLNWNEINLIWTESNWTEKNVLNQFTQ